MNSISANCQNNGTFIHEFCIQYCSIIYPTGLRDEWKSALRQGVSCSINCVLPAGKSVIIFILLSEQILKLWSWKTRKGHGKSWNFKNFKEYEPCTSICSVTLLAKTTGLWSLLVHVNIIGQFYNNWTETCYDFLWQIPFKPQRVLTVANKSRILR